MVRRSVWKLFKLWKLFLFHSGRKPRSFKISCKETENEKLRVENNILLLELLFDWRASTVHRAILLWELLWFEAKIACSEHPQQKFLSTLIHSLTPVVTPNHHFPNPLFCKIPNLLNWSLSPKINKLLCIDLWVVAFGNYYVVGNYDVSKLTVVLSMKMLASLIHWNTRWISIFLKEEWVKLISFMNTNKHSVFLIISVSHSRVRINRILLCAWSLSTFSKNSVLAPLPFPKHSWSLSSIKSIITARTV